MLQKSTINFLKNLKKNNNKPWFDENRKQYEEAKKDFLELVESTIQAISKLDADYENIKAKDCLFRINRDVRFSKDKSPYKTNFGAAFSIGGKKGNLAGFYVHIEPNSCFIGGGIWMPEADTVKKIRQEIDYNFKDFKKIISSKKFADYYGSLSTENSLVNAPKGYELENPAIEFLKMKSFTAGKKLNDELLNSNQLQAEINKGFAILKPFIDFLNTAVKND